LCASFPDEIAPLESLIRITSPHLEGRSSEIEVPLLESRFGHRPESHRVQELLVGLQPVAPSHLFHRQGWCTGGVGQETPETAHGHVESALSELLVIVRQFRPESRHQITGGHELVRTDQHHPQQLPHLASRDPDTPTVALQLEWPQDPGTHSATLGACINRGSAPWWAAA